MQINASAENFYSHLKTNNLILFETIVGSQAYGTSIPESDTDYKFVYILPDYLYGFIPQTHVNKDFVGYEIGEFLSLVEKNNPTILELLSSPPECVTIKHPIFDMVLKEKEKFITKKCADSFGGYSRGQIKKAKGQNKMMNWEKSKLTRKTPLDFCFIIDGYETKSLKKFLKHNGYDQKFCGISKVPNARDLYALFYDQYGFYCFSERLSNEEREHNKKTLEESNKCLGLGYKGIEKVGGAENHSISNDLRLSSIPKGESIICVFSYNKDSYTQHCRDYNKYQEWIKNRNEKRWTDVKSHNQKIDGKNMMHCMRLIDMSIEIAEGKGIIVKRPNAKELLSIRNGEVDLDTLIKTAEEKIKRMDDLFFNSNLPAKVDHKFIQNILKKIRNNFKF
ncbi:MAG: nucleotidyltransferase domain-containing protein [Candidatus Izemoplasmatales bacterium]